jgi:hypothetical protein
MACRIRRVKCDELKPNCNRCTSTGRKCDGYNAPPAAKTFSSFSNKTTSIGKPSSLFVQTFSSPLECVEEKEILHFFQTYAAVELCGYFASSFWLREIMQAAQTQPAIRYGITALGAMHRRYISGDSSSVPEDTSDKQLRFALQQSNYAIQELLKKPANRSKADMMAVMTCCILFNSLACLQGHQQDALNHLRSGIRLLNEYDHGTDVGNNPVNAHPISLDSIRAIILMLDTQARAIMSEPDILHWEPQPKRSDYTTSFIHTTTSFVSQRSALHYLEATFSDLMAFLQDLEVLPVTGMGDVEATSRRLQHQSRNGKEMLDNFLAEDRIRNSAHCKKGNEQRLIALRLIQTLISMLARALEKKSSALWPTFEVLPTPFFTEERQFAMIMDLTTQLIEAKAASKVPFSRKTTHRPVFMSTLGVVVALYIVATRAPEYDMRRKAINILLEYPRREGMWDGPLAGKIALETLVLEEESTRQQLGLVYSDPPFMITHASQVPTDLWIRTVNIKYTGLREARVEYRNLGNMRENEPGWVRHISW